MSSVLAIAGVPRHYAWGSVTAIPQLRGETSDGQPVAELWFGTHPDAPSPIVGADGTLADVVDLPYLLKLLAADKPLSIQVHPTRAQAQAGFDREDAAGIPREAPDRNYRDRNHKPELLAALTLFEALCGFRPIADTLRLLDAFGMDELAEVRELLAGSGLRAAFTHLLRIDEPASLVDAVVTRAADLADSEWAGPARAVALTAAEFPGDVGVVITLLLNYVRLEPGEAIFLGAGNVHCYLRGLGVEIMANSDNVLRCGLTPKHVDVDEVLAVTDFVELADPRFPNRGDGTFAPPVADFELRLLDLDGEGTVHHDGPLLVLGVDSELAVAANGVSADLSRGAAAYVASDSGDVTLRGTGRAVIAAAPS